MLAHWVWLAHRPGLTDWLKWQILQKYGTPENVYFSDGYEDIEHLTAEGYRALMDKNLGPAEKILEKCVNKRLHLMTVQDAAYPQRLRNIPDPPLVLYYKGQMPELDSTAVISVVGTRHASAYGLTVAQRMGYQITKCGGIVVSGMAMGVDSAAMVGGLMGDGPVVGVLGCGVDQIYPARNKNLFADVERYGCILSEFPPETPPLAWHFPKRNRIISGLGCGVLVVEAPAKSGALITAHQALDQGRDVFVVPGNILVDSCQGSNRLLREGAAAVGCGWDILSEYVHLFPDRLHDNSLAPQSGQRSIARVAEPKAAPQSKTAKQPLSPEKPEQFPGHPGGENRPSGKKAIDKAGTEPYIDINDILKTCNPQEKAIVLALKDGESLVDDVIAKTGLKTQEVLSSLTMLEIRGVLQRHAGRRISLRK